MQRLLPRKARFSRRRYLKARKLGEGKNLPVCPHGEKYRDTARSLKRTARLIWRTTRFTRTKNTAGVCPRSAHKMGKRCSRSRHTGVKMNVLNVSEMSKTYRVKKLTVADVDEIFALCEKNPLDYQYYPPFVTKIGIEEDMRALPLKSERDKYYVGFFDDSGLIAIADVIAAYPNAQTAFIGFFMTAARVQNKGVGSCHETNCANFLRCRLRFRSARLRGKIIRRRAHFGLKTALFPPAKFLINRLRYRRGLQIVVI